jgi:diguanylate cyclase (GGDEF)-like protein
MEQARMEETPERLGRALRTLSGCNRALLRTGDEAALLGEICRVVVEEGGYCMARIGRAEHDEGRSVTILAQEGLVREEGEIAALCWSDTERGRSATGIAIRTGVPCVIHDALGESFPAFWREFSRRNGIGSVLGLPLRIQGEIFGALTIAAPEADAFDGPERQVLDQAAEDLAFGLEVLRLRHRREQAEVEVRHLNRALRTRASVNRALAHAQDETALLAEICRVVVEDCSYRLAWVACVQEDGGLRPVTQAGCDEAFMAPRHEWGASEGARAVVRRLQGGRPVILRGLDHNPAYPFRDEAREHGYGAVVVLPLNVDGVLVGSLHIVALDADAFDPQEVELLLATTADLGWGLGALRQRVRAAAAEERIRRMALFDAVTELPNREQMRQWLEEAIAQARGEHRPLAFLRIGLEHFRDVNETLGSAEVDAFVRAVAQRLRQAVGAAGRLGRLLEGEFAVLLPRAGAEPARALAQRLLVALYDPIEIAGLLLDAR